MDEGDRIHYILCEAKIEGFDMADRNWYDIRIRNWKMEECHMIEI